MAFRRSFARALAAVLLAAPGPLLAAPPPPAQPAPGLKAEAVAHFEKGLALYDEGAWAPALAELLEARRLFPLRNAGYQAALCLEKLERYDEALDQLEGVLRDFGDTMPQVARERVQREVLRVRELVGTIEIDGAEAGAAVTVEGRSRGEVPLLAPLRVAAGSHLVRVFKQGFEPFEARVEVAGGRSVRVEVKLVPLARTGRLQIQEQEGRALDVVVDGSVVGKVPWGAPLSPGEHVVALRGEGDLGTPPARVVVEEDRTVSLTLAAEPLAASLRVEPVPLGAGVAIDGVTVGRGVWEGRLRAGAHEVEVAAPGFHPASRRPVLARGGRQVVRVALERDESSPFWRRPPRRPRFLVEATTAALLVPRFGGDVADSCIDACQSALGLGAATVLHAGYELGSRIGFGVTAGYLAAAQRLIFRATQASTTALAAPVPGTVDDRLALRGALLGAWAGYTLGDRVPVFFRLGAGVLAGDVLDERTSGSFAASDGSTFSAGPLAERHGAVFAYVMPEARVGWPVGRHLTLEAGLSVPVLIGAHRPVWSTTHTFRAGGDGAGQFGPDTLAGEVVAAIAPGIGARCDF